MKKLTTLVLAAGLVVSSFAGASAAEFKPSATFINQFEFANAGSKLATDSGFGYNEHFRPSTRIDLGFDYIVNENLSATFLVRTEFDYGTGEFDTNLVAKDVVGERKATVLGVRLAYVDWMIPTTDVQVRLGYQPAALPAFAFGSAVLDTRGSGVAVVAPINENIGVTAQWVRISGNDIKTGTTGGVRRGADDADAFIVMADFDYDGFRIAPWAMYGIAGQNVATALDGPSIPQGQNVGSIFSDNVNAWWIGASFELSMFDPFVFALDAYYSDASGDVYRAHGGDYDQSGFLVGASFAYNTQWGTPALKAWYASGDDDVNSGHFRNDDFGRPLSLSGAFAATTIMFDDSVMDNGLSNATGGNPAGTWGVVLQWADFSFIEKLTHTARIAYIGGTNDAVHNYPGTLDYLTDDDSVVEINLNSTYEIYKNFSTSLELGWLAADFDHDYHADQDDDILRAALSFTFNF